MELGNQQNSALESRFFEIPIEEYEEFIETNSAKGKKNEILELLQNYNQLHSEEEYKEVRDCLFDAIRSGDLDLIKIYLSETIENNSNTLKFKIDKTDRTASLFAVDKNVQEFIIPRTIEHETVEYLITSISGISLDYNNNIKTIKFVEDSAVKIIYGDAFIFLEIEEISLPKSLEELKNDWSFGADMLTKISISPMNDHFMMKENKYLVGKSDLNNNEFDILVFANRDIEEITIPSNIKIILSDAFYNCENLTRINFQTNSNLQTIGDHVFSKLNIEEISIPASVTKICEYAFHECKNLSKVEIPTNSNLQIIESNAFSNSKIKEIYFPTSLKELEKGWCCYTGNLIKITISPLNDQFMMKENKYLVGKIDPNNNEFDILLFANRDIVEISIPSNIKIISSYAFHECKNLTKVEFQPNSNLQTIESNAFSYSNIDEISIPSKVTKLCKNAFFYCSNLTKIEIPTNSNLQIIESNAFSNSKIKEIYFPTSLKELEKGWCYYTGNLIKITISPLNDQFMMKENKYLVGKIDPNNNEFDILLFANRDIVEISIPSNIKIISSYAFHECKNLTKVEFPTNSNLQTIESYTFSLLGIKGIFIPSKVLKICDNAFFYCRILQIIEISEESKLGSFPFGAFSPTTNIIIMIPTSLEALIQNLFSSK